MQITSKFTIAIHAIACIYYFEDSQTVTSALISGSTGANRVIVRNILGDLKNAGIINSSQGKSGISLLKKLNEISFYDIYTAIGGIGAKGLFNFHDNPNPKCDIGRNIHDALDDRLMFIQNSFENSLKDIYMSEIIDQITEKLKKEH